jgi:hypothetical protein
MKNILCIFCALLASIAFAQPTTPINNARITGTSTAASSSATSLLGPVLTIAALEALPVTALTTNTSVNVLGYYAANDGGGGSFTLNKSSSATVDHGLVCSTPSGGTTRWLRNFTPPLNVRWFGAVLDGVTNDGAKIQQAITSAQSLYGGSTVAGGTTVVIDQAPNFGAVTITVGVTGTAPDDSDGKPINLQLQYYGSAIGSANPMFELASRSRIQGINRRFTRISKTGAGPIIQITASAEDCDISDLKLYGGANAVKLKASVTSGDVPAIRIRNLFCEAQTGDALPFCSLSDGTILDNVFVTAPTGAGLRLGVMDGNATGGTNENAKVTNCFFQSCGTKGIWIETDTAALQSSQTIQSTTFDNVQISGPANQAFFCKMLTPGGLVLTNIQLASGPTGTPNTYAAIEFNGAFGGIQGVSISSVAAASTSNWKNIFKFSGGGSYGTNNVIRQYQNNGATTAIYDIDSNAGVRIEDPNLKTGLVGFNYLNKSGQSGLVTGSYQPAGNVGEVMESVVASPGTSLTTGTSANVTSLTLTAGNWQLSGVVYMHGAATTTFTTENVGINSTSAVLPTKNSGRQNSSIDTWQTVLDDKSYIAPTFTVSISSTTIYYLVAQASFGTSTCSAYGGMTAVRLP